jgi:hypothetical protein
MSFRVGAHLEYNIIGYTHALHDCPVVAERCGLGLHFSVMNYGDRRFSYLDTGQ